MYYIYVYKYTLTSRLSLIPQPTQDLYRKLFISILISTQEIILIYSCLVETFQFHGTESKLKLQKDAPGSSIFRIKEQQIFRPQTQKETLVTNQQNSEEKIEHCNLIF